MQIFILILTLNSSFGASIHSVEIKGEKACYLAAKAWVKATPNSTGGGKTLSTDPSAVCISKNKNDNHPIIRQIHPEEKTKNN